MAKSFKNLTVKIRSGRSVTVGVTVRGTIDESNRNSHSGKIIWRISDVDFTVPGSSDDGRVLSQDEKNEVEKLLGERVDSESWQFND